MSETRRERPVLVYDGDCAFCTTCVGWMERHLRNLPDVVAWQHADLSALGVTQAACEKAVQWVEPSGRVRSGAAAVGTLFVRSGWPWRVLGWMCLVPPVSWVAELVYKLVSANRSRLPGGTPACSMPAHLRPGAASRDTDAAA